MPVGAELTPEQRHRRRVLSRLWALLVIAWAFGRTLVVWAAVGDYGINPWWYLAVDLVCAAVDAYTTPKTVLALIDGKPADAVLWGTASVVAFVLPDVYIFLATDELPRSIIVIVGAVIVATLVFTLVGVRRKVRVGRAALPTESVPPPPA